MPSTGAPDSSHEGTLSTNALKSLLLPLGVALLLTGCESAPPGRAKGGNTSKSKAPAVVMPACEGSGATPRLSTTPTDAPPMCDDLGTPAPTTVSEPIAKLAIIYDALPLAGRSWASFVDYPAAWGRPSEQWVDANVKVAGLDTPAAFCRPIQSFGRTASGTWSPGSCDQPAGAAGASDTRADAALKDVCASLASGTAPFDAAVLVFDHIIDSPSVGEDGAAKFAEAVVGCGEADLVMRLVAQPGAHRYGYLIAKPGTTASLRALSARLKELFTASAAHTTSPNAIFRSDKKACPEGVCPNAYDIALSKHFQITRGSKVALSRQQPTWGRPASELPKPVRDARNKLPAPLRPDAFATICGNDVAVSANSNRPMADEAGLAGFAMSWKGQIGERRVQEDYPFLEERLRAEVSVAKSARSAPADLELKPEAAWSNRMSAAPTAVPGVELEVGPASASSMPCAPEDHTSITPILRVENESLSLVYWRSRAGDGAAAGKLSTAFPAFVRATAFQADNTDMELGERFGWLAGTTVGHDVSQFNVGVNSTALELDCITRTMEQTLSSVVSFKADDFNAWLCTPQRKEQCPTLTAVCDNAETQPKMGIFFRDLFKAPAVKFGGSNRRAPDNARAATLSIARVFSAVAASLNKSMPAAVACSNARVSIGCAAKGAPKPAAVASKPAAAPPTAPAAGSGSVAAAPVAGSGAGSGAAAAPAGSGAAAPAAGSGAGSPPSTKGSGVKQ